MMAQEPDEAPGGGIFVEIAKSIGLIKTPGQKRIEARQRTLKLRIYYGISSAIVIICWLDWQVSYVNGFITLILALIAAGALSFISWPIASYIAKYRVQSDEARQRAIREVETLANAAKEAAAQAAEAATGAIDAVREAEGIAAESITGRELAKKTASAAASAESAAKESAKQAATAALATAPTQTKTIEGVKQAEQITAAAKQAAIASATEASKHAAIARQALEDARQALSTEKANFEYFLKRLNQVEIYLGFLKGADQNTRNNIQQSISKELTGLVTKLHSDSSTVALLQRNKTLQSLLQTMRAGLNVYELQITQASSILEAAQLE